MYKEEILEGFDNTPIYTVSSENDENKGRLLILHGLHDHCGRYAHLADYFNERGFATVRYDMRGYGNSGGVRGYIDQFDDFTKDLDTVVGHFMKGSDIPNYLFAHSMGSLIGSLHILKYGNPYDGVIYSGGLFKVNEDLSPLLQKMSGVMSRILPKLQTIKLDANGLSRDPDIALRIAGDKLHYMGGVRARTGSEILKATAKLQAELEKLDFPMLILHGGADPLTKHEASELLYSKSKSEDKTLKIYPGAYHELINEINKEEVLSDIYGWIIERLREE
jgi:acylglycerol lipase